MDIVLKLFNSLTTSGRIMRPKKSPLTTRGHITRPVNTTQYEQLSPPADLIFNKKKPTVITVKFDPFLKYCLKIFKSLSAFECLKK